MNNGHGGWLISSHACSNLPAEACSAWRSNFKSSCRLSSFYLSLFFLLWLPITELCRVLKLMITDHAKCLCAACIQSPHISVESAMTLGACQYFEVSVPTLINNELIKKQLRFIHKNIFTTGRVSIANCEFSKHQKNRRQRIHKEYYT